MNSITGTHGGRGCGLLSATGKRNFLDIAIRYADCVCKNIGEGEGQQIRVPDIRLPKWHWYTYIP